MLRPITGHLEEALSAQVETLVGPHLVTEVLSLVVDSLGGSAATRDRVRDLCVADRQTLVRRLGFELGLTVQWVTGRCDGCGERFDVAVEPAALPCKAASDTFPFAMVELSTARAVVRAPNGADQEALADRFVRPSREAERVLSQRCIVELAVGDVSKPVEELRLTDADVDRIELALEAMVPEAITEVHSQCPGCGRDQVLPLDPYWALEQLPSSLREQVHTIASAYHWSEADILALPRARRHDYLALIDANWTEQVG